MPSFESEIAIVLAAGRGRRMGGPKALMVAGTPGDPVGPGEPEGSGGPVDPEGPGSPRDSGGHEGWQRGRVWWAVQAARLEAIGITSLWVVSPVVQAELTRAGARIATTQGDPESPMFDSIVRGVESLRQRKLLGVFVLPVDVPAPSRPVWEALSRAGGPAAVPAFQGRMGHPVRLDWAWIDGLLPADAGAPMPRLDELVAPVRTVVPVDDPGVCVNLNLPDELRRWRG